MAEYTQASIKTKIDADLADNVQGGITAETLRTSLKNVVDSVIPIMASGEDIYFINDLDIRDNSIVSANQSLGLINGQWSNKNVASIEFRSGSDTTNRDDAHIVFYTSASGVASTTGGPGPKKRMTIGSNGVVTVFGSGQTDPAMFIRSIHGSGLNLLLDDSPQNVAVLNDTSFNLGHWASGSSVFTERFTINPLGYVGIGVKPLQPLHIRHSGEAIRFDSQVNANNTADLYLGKYRTATTAYADSDFYMGFGLGVSTSASGAGYFFIGSDSDRGKSVVSTEALFVLDSGGNVAIGNNYPKEKLEIGDGLGRITASGDGNAVSIASKMGDSHLYLGSGNGISHLSNYGHIKWEGNKHRLVIDTKSAQIPKREQFVIDSTNGNVGIGNSGISVVHTWRPNHNLHVSGSGTPTTLAVENALNTNTAIHIGKDTHGSGILTYSGTDDEKGHWATIGYKSSSEVLKINNSGSFVPSHLTVNRLGQVGINTDSPYNNTSVGTNHLHVYGTNSAMIVGDPFGGSNSALRLLGSRSTNNTAYVQTGTSAADTDAKLRITRFDTDGTNFHKMEVYADSSQFHGSGVFNQVSLNGNLLLNDNWVSNDGGNEGIRVTNAGKVGINVAEPTYELQLSSNSAGKPISSVWSVVSDQTTKKNVQTLTGSLSKIMELRPVSFNFTEEYCDYFCAHDHESQYNFIAQEVEEVFPEAVKLNNVTLTSHATGETKNIPLRSIDAHIINIHMVSALQELKQELEDAKQRISELESS